MRGPRAVAALSRCLRWQPVTLPGDGQLYPPILLSRAPRDQCLPGYGIPGDLSSGRIPTPSSPAGRAENKLESVGWAQGSFSRARPEAALKHLPNTYPFPETKATCLSTSDRTSLQGTHTALSEFPQPLPPLLTLVPCPLLQQK